jgi:hypothetical protein
MRVSLAASAAFFFCLCANGARAQSSQSQLYQLYLSTSTPLHYKQAIAKLLNLPPPQAPGGASPQDITPQDAPSSSVAEVQIACNPLRPGCELLMFRNLPAEARLRIYTIAGALVKDMNADSNGDASWDGTNKSGAPCASGVYFVYAQGGGTRKTFKVAIQR